MIDIFEDNENEPTIQDNPPQGYDPSPKTRKQMERLLSEEKAQQGRNWAYYENLRKTDPAKYWHPRTQVQMHRDSDALGKAFEPSEEDDNG